MALVDAQILWVNDFAGTVGAKKAYDDELALKRAILEEVRGKIEVEKEKIREAITFKVGGRKALDQKGAQLTEADSTEYGKAELSWEEVIKVSKVESVIDALDKKMSEPTVLRTDNRGAPVEQPLFTEQEIADELYTPLVRERILPETLVPSLYSETARMIQGSNEAYLEDLEEYSKSLEEEEESLATAGMRGLSKLSAIGGKLATAFPGSDAELAKNVLNLCSHGLNGVADGYEKIRKGEFSSASNSIVDNIGVLMKGVLSMVVDPEVAETAANIYAAGASAGKVSIALAKGEPGEAFDALANGLSEAMSAANKENQDPFAKAVVDLVARQLRNAKNIESISVAIKERNFAGVVDGVTQTASSAMNAGLSFCGEIEKQSASESEKERIDKKYQDIANKADAALTGGGLALKTGEAVAKSISAGNKREAAETLIASLGGVLQNSLTIAGVNEDMSTTIGTAFTSASNGGLAIVELTKEEPDKSKVADLLGQAVTGAMKQASPDNKNLQDTATMLGASFTTLAKSVGIVEAYRAEDASPEKMQAAAKELAEALKSVMGGAFKVNNDKQTEGMTEEGKQAFLLKQQQLQAGLGEGIDNLESEISASLELLSSPEAEEAIIKAEEEAALERIKLEQESVMEILKHGGDSGQAASDAVAISKLIAQMQRDQMLLQMAVSVAKMPLGMAAKWVPALGPAATALQLAENLVKAANRALALNQWVRDQKDLRRAQDALESSAQNFVKNQSEQFSHYTIQAAFNVAQIIGQVLEIAGSGMASAAGTGLKAAAEAGAAIENVIYEYYKKATVEAAWHLTQKALRNPKNRRLALEARAINPTLAKYSIAWSAIVRENPLARNIMNEIGLSERSLRQKDSNVKNVVKYMELKFSDDVQVRKRLNLKEAYMPSPVELTAKCWCLGKVRAEADEETPLAAITACNIDGLIAEVGLIRPKVIKGRDDLTLSSAMAQDYLELLENLETALERYRPQAIVAGKSAKEPHAAMTNFVDDLLDLCTVEKIDARNAVVDAEELEIGEDIANLFPEN